MLPLELKKEILIDELNSSVVLYRWENIVQILLVVKDLYQF